MLIIDIMTMIQKENNRMYKKDTTSYLTQDIPVSLWKKVRAKVLTDDIKSVGSVITSLLESWVKGKVKL
tara:strand:- start:4943 stop:5149 length:207 start_codon:yes stop_codon:yes gene_type:complete